MSLAIVKRAARVSVPVILAVDHSALDSFLDLMRGNQKKNLSSHCREQQEGSHSISAMFPPPPYLSAQDAVNHDDDETFQRDEDGKEDLEKGGAAVSDGQHSRHPGEGQQGQNHTGAPE